MIVSIQIRRFTKSLNPNTTWHARSEETQSSISRQVLSTGQNVSSGCNYHEQIQASATGSYLLTHHSCFHEVTNNILSIDRDVLDNLIDKLSDGDWSGPYSFEEGRCFKALKDVNHVTGNMDGSMSKKKKLQAQLWSPLAYHSTPLWFITFSPADHKHPISSYYAGQELDFDPTLLSQDKQFRRMSSNPVAAARFFHLMVRTFIKHILCIDKTTPGVFGRIKGCYGTVEQQGSLTLHIHMLLWIECSLLPLQIRQHLLNNHIGFMDRLLVYLNGCHTSDFLGDHYEGFKASVDTTEQEADRVNPTKTLPEPPPTQDHNLCSSEACILCAAYRSWLANFTRTVNHILFRVNYHKCSVKNCLNNKKNKCKSCFFCDRFPTTTVDMDTGHLNLQKKEYWLNPITPLLVYLLQCNMDTTSLLSGTAIKAAFAYITD